MANIGNPNNPHMVICRGLDPWKQEQMVLIPKGFRAISVLSHAGKLWLHLRGPSKEIYARPLQVFIVKNNDELPVSAFHCVGSVMHPLYDPTSWPTVALHIFTE